MQPGIYNLTNQQYHESDGLSASGVKLLAASPYKYWYRYVEGNNKYQKSKSMDIGSAVHKMCLEQSDFFHEYVFMPENIKRRQGKEWEKFAKDNLDRQILSANEYYKVCAMSAALKAHPIFADIFASGSVEQSIYWQDENGVLLKTRPDWYNDELIIDVKTTSSIDEADIANTIAYYRYDIQAAMQIDGLYAATNILRKHLLLFVEESEPYETDMFCIDNDSLQFGRAEYLKQSMLFNFYNANNTWPQKNTHIKSVSLPNWFIKKYI